MRQTTKKSVAVLLAVLQLFVLLPELAPQAQAANAEPEIPVLNETIVGTVKFQSFNFLGDNATGEDGTDYQTTFYYTDDYFAPSAINEEADSRTMLWSDLDNPSLAACSMDFAVASYTSAEGDVIRASSQTWNNTDYSNKDKNVKQFLGDCGFTNVEPHALTQRPTNNSIGYTLGSKTIKVWNADTQKNETYTLIAVGVRGAGYGAEWASNITIGDPSTNALPANGRHYGFDHSAQTVCAGIRDYLSDHNITGNVKYWVTGFSRAAAVANLVAGYLTDGGSTYKTQQKDVFGYTWECPQAAKKTSSPDTNFTNYKNIHNILNPMDAVPKVSPDGFDHQRLGVDYQMPYHGTPNLSTTTHTALYNQMFEVLKTIAVGNGTDPDPLVDNKDTDTANDGYVSPDVYPYKSKMTIYKMSGWQLIQDAIGGTDKLMSNFGTVVASGNLDNSSKLLGRSDGGWYIDQFIDHLIDVFLTSNAWIGGVGNNRTAIQNRTTFIQNYQKDFRNLFGYFLDFSGPAFLDLIPKLIDAIRPQLTDITNLGLGYAFYKFYNEPNGSFSSLNVFAGQFRGKPYKTALIYYAKSTAKEVANDMVSGFSDPQGISKATMNSAMDNVVELVINLYAYELDAYESQYLGTTLRYLWEILCTHEQETVLSWIMSLDPNHMNRSARTITIPAGCDAVLYEYRPEYEGNLTDELNPAAPVVAEVKNGALVSDTLKDQRIFSTTSNGNVVVRYPASLQIRADITSNDAFNTSSVSVADYRTANAYTNVSKGKSQFETTALNSSTGYSSVTSTTATNVTATNSALSGYGQLAAGDTLHVLADDIQTFNANNASTYTLLVDKAPVTTVLEYGTVDSGLTAGTSQSSAVQLGGTSSTSTEQILRGIRTRQTVTTVPASSIYYDDDFTTPVSGKDFGDSVYSVNSETVDGGQKLYFKFSGTRVDVYCTTNSETGYVQAAVYEDNNGQLGERKGIVSTLSASDTPRFNVPTISFDGLEAGQQYFLVLNILNSSNYHLDGIRVYNSEASSAATFANLRELLLGESEVAGLANEPIEGAAFYVDHAEEGDSHIVALANEDYANISPKNEVYLAQGQSVAFQIDGTYESVAVGLSAPDGNGNGQVTVTDGSTTKSLSISSVVDTYYTIKPSANGYVSIHNDTDVLISVTNVRIEGFQPAAQSRSAVVVSPGLRSYAASFLSLPASPGVEAPETTPAPGDTPAPETTPTPTTDPVTQLVEKLISQFVERLFDSVTRLFGN